MNLAHPQLYETPPKTQEIFTLREISNYRCGREEGRNLGGGWELQLLIALNLGYWYSKEIEY